MSGKSVILCNVDCTYEERISSTGNVYRCLVIHIPCPNGSTVENVVFLKPSERALIDITLD